PAKPPPARLREPEPEPAKTARVETPPVKAPPAETAPQETRKPAASPPATAVEAPAPAATSVASLNLPNRPAAARDIKIGDKWTYRLRDASLSRDLATVTHEVSGGDKSGIRETLRLGPRGDAQR